MNLNDRIAAIQASGVEITLVHHPELQQVAMAKQVIMHPNGRILAMEIVHRACGNSAAAVLEQIHAQVEACKNLSITTPTEIVTDGIINLRQ